LWVLTRRAYLAQAKFAAEVNGLDIEFHQLSVYDIAQLGERFDVVPFLGVLSKTSSFFAFTRDLSSKRRQVDSANPENDLADASALYRRTVVAAAPPNEPPTGGHRRYDSPVEDHCSSGPRCHP
jgi:hypothetical protein